MIVNKIYHINTEEVERILQKAYQDKSMHLIEIQGNHVQSWNDYIINIEEKMKFPTSCIDSIDRYLDWIRDLSWLNKDGHIIVIYDYATFLLKDPQMKEIIMTSFQDSVLPFWQKDVEHCVVGGRAKLFNVYLVD